MDNIKNSTRLYDKEEQEIREIFARADDSKTESLFIDNEGDIHLIDEIKQILIPDATDDPSAKYDRYYQGIQKLLKRGLPEGEMYKEARALVREEISIFLTRGKEKKGGVRGADSRQAFLPDMDIALACIITWFSSAQSTFELYSAFKELNKRYLVPPSV